MNLKDRKEPNFIDIDDVLTLAREVAEADYKGYLKAMAKAADAPEREAIQREIEKSMVASRQLASAQDYFIKSRETNKTATVDMLKGDTFAADSNFKTSGAQMQQAAEGLARFSEYVPQSRMMAAAINFVAKRDEMISKAGLALDSKFAAAETKVARTAESFSRGLKSFAESMHNFGTKIANAPSQIKELARETSSAIYVATTSFALGLISRFSEKLDDVKNAMGAKANDLKDSAQAKAAEAKETAIRGRDAAWDTVDRLSNATAKLANDVKDASVRGVEAADRGIHGVTAVAKAPVVLAATVLKALGAAVSANYHEGASARDEVQQKRKMRPS